MEAILSELNLKSYRYANNNSCSTSVSADVLDKVKLFSYCGKKSFFSHVRNNKQIYLLVQFSQNVHKGLIFRKWSTSFGQTMLNIIVTQKSKTKIPILIHTNFYSLIIRSFESHLAKLFCGILAGKKLNHNWNLVNHN